MTTPTVERVRELREALSESPMAVAFCLESIGPDVLRALIDELLALRTALGEAREALEAGAAALDHVVTLRLTRAPNARENCVNYAAALRQLAGMVEAVEKQP